MRLHHKIGINDADYDVYYHVDGKQMNCPFYSKWAAMIARCYSGKDPIYDGCSVAPEWDKFSNFKAWMENQDWHGKQLDKDLLVVGNKVYSPDNCIFLPVEWNSTFQRRRKKVNSDRPIGTGVSHAGTFTASISINGKGCHLGSAKTILEAHALWQKAIVNKIIKFANTQDGRIKEALILRASIISNDIKQGLETFQI